MSAGAPVASATRTNQLDLLAPRFRLAVENALADFNALLESGDHAIVYETYRSPELQALYYERGRSIIPPAGIVTNAQSNLYSWHGFGLAVDIIHKTKEWNAGDAWFRAVADVLMAYGLRWGGEWKMKDLPHFQWGRCKPSPSDRAREILAQGGLPAVWREVNAD
jgi:hypothetical protein